MMKKWAAVIFLFSVSFSFAEQFTNIYETFALCTTIRKIEYCRVRDAFDLFAVINYEAPGNILLLLKGYPEYIPSGTASHQKNSNGIDVDQNDYVEKETGKKKHIVYSSDNLWISSEWNGKTYCKTMKYWIGDKRSFKKTYPFKEVPSLDSLHGLQKRCLEQK